MPPRIGAFPCAQKGAKRSDKCTATATVRFNVKWPDGSRGYKRFCDEHAEDFRKLVEQDAEGSLPPVEVKEVPL